MKKLLLFLLILACIPLYACKTPIEEPKGETNDAATCNPNFSCWHESYEEFQYALTCDPRGNPMSYHDPYLFSSSAVGKFYDSFIAVVDDLETVHKPLFDGQPMELSMSTKEAGIYFRAVGINFYLPEIEYVNSDGSVSICIIYLATLENDVALTKNDVIDVLPYIYFHERIEGNVGYIHKLKTLLAAERISLQLADRTVIAYEYVTTNYNGTKSTQYYTFLYDGMIVEVCAHPDRINAEFFRKFSLG